MNCPNCHQECANDMKFCPHCGADLSANRPDEANAAGAASQEEAVTQEAVVVATVESQPEAETVSVQAEAPQTQYCAQCGAPLAPNTAYCPNCGFCQGNARPSSAKSKIAAGLLGIFLGAFGVHNFYLGYYTKAIIQLLLTVVGIPLCCLFIGFFMITAAGIWGLIEGILILTGQIATDAQGVPLSD